MGTKYMYIADIDEIESEYQWLMDGDTVHVQARI